MSGAHLRSLGDRVSFRVPAAVSSRAITGIAAAGLVISYFVTWDLWEARIRPPNLPAVGALSSFEFGVPLVLLALAAIAFPGPGAAAHGAVLVLAVLGDQVRLQPEFISLAIILAAGAWPPTSIAVGRWHLVALWGWAGLHKILSGGWPSGGALFVAEALGDARLRPVVAVVLPICEIGLAILALSRKTWPMLRVAAPLFHLGISLALFRDNTNSSVWPWNVALAGVAILLFRSSPAPRPVEGRPLVVTAAAAVFLVYPLGFYAGFSDAYPSHNLYSSNTAQAALCSGDPAAGCSAAAFSTWASLNVPLPPERRLYITWFRQVCQPGQRLRIDGIWTRLHERRVEYLECRPPAATAG